MKWTCGYNRQDERTMRSCSDNIYVTTEYVLFVQWKRLSTWLSLTGHFKIKGINFFSVELTGDLSVSAECGKH